MPAHQFNSGGNRKGLGTEVWGLATWAREPGTDKLTDRMTDIFCRPSRPPNPELGFTTLGQNELQYHDVSTYLRAWYKGKKNDSPIELGD